TSRNYIKCRKWFFFSSRRRHTISKRDWSSDVCSSDLTAIKNIKTQVIRECHNDTTRDINAHRNSWRSSSNAVCRWCSLAAACFALPLTPKSIISTPLCWKLQKVVCKQLICHVFQKNTHNYQELIRLISG